MAVYARAAVPARIGQCTVIYGDPDDIFFIIKKVRRQIAVKTGIAIGMLRYDLMVEPYHSIHIDSLKLEDDLFILPFGRYNYCFLILSCTTREKSGAGAR